MASFTDLVTASKRYKLGTTKTVNGNVFIYLQGVASTAIGSWVTFTSAGVTTLYVAAGKGRLAVAMSANILTTTFGWYQIFGSAQGLAAASYAANAKVWATATPGVVDDADVATDLVAGAIGRTTIGAAQALVTFDLSYPFAHAEVMN